MRDVLDIYKGVLSGNLKRFPINFWSPDNNGKSRYVKCLRFLVRNLLELNREDILNITKPFLKKYKLAGGLEHAYEGRIHDAVQDSFPEESILIWEFAKPPDGIWDDELTRILAVRWIYIKTYGYNREAIIDQANTKLLADNGLGRLMQLFENNYELLANSFPEFKIKEYEVKFVRTKDDLRKIVKEFIENTLGLGKKDIENKLFRTTFVDYGLKNIIDGYFRGSVYNAVKLAYPEDNWNSLRNPHRGEQFVNIPRGHLSPNSKLSLKERREIKDSGKKTADLAREYGVSNRTINKIKNENLSEEGE